VTPRPHLDIRRVWDIAPGARRAYVLLALVTLALGAVILLGGRARATAPAWRVVYTMGGPEVFGGTLVALGLLLLVAPALSARVVSWVMILAAAAMLLLSIAFFSAAASDPRASWTGGVIYLFLALHLVSHRVAYREGVPGERA
jgi:hypothetical protein